MKNFKIPVIVVCAFLLIQSTCDQNIQNIPYVPVNFDINLNLPAYNSLNFPGDYCLQVYNR